MNRILLPLLAAAALPAIAARLSPEDKARADALLKPPAKKS